MNSGYTYGHRMLRIVWTLALGVLLSACATSGPRAGEAVATGEPLGVAVSYRVVEETTTEPLETVRATSSTGEEVVIDYSYERPILVAEESWRLQQGERHIDEVDFYTIAGREDLADDVLRARRRTRIARNSLIASLVVGVGLATAGSVGAIRANRQGAEPSTTSSVLAGSGVLLAATSIAVGGLIKEERLRPGYVIGEQEEMAKVAREYNESIGVRVAEPPSPPLEAELIYEIEPGTGKRVEPPKTAAER